MVGNWTGNLVSGSCASLTLYLQRLSALLGSPVLSAALGSIGLLSSSNSLRVPGPDLGGTRKLWLSCGFQLFEAAVVASFKSGCGSIADETPGAIYSRVALGLGARPRA